MSEDQATGAGRLGKDVRVWSRLIQDLEHACTIACVHEKWQYIHIHDVVRIH